MEQRLILTKKNALMSVHPLTKSLDRRKDNRRREEGRRDGGSKRRHDIIMTIFESDPNKVVDQKTVLFLV